MIRLRTDAPQYYSDLGDVLRLFYGDVTVSLAEDGAAGEGPDDRLFEHRFLNRVLHPPGTQRPLAKIRNGYLQCSENHPVEAALGGV